MLFDAMRNGSAHLPQTVVPHQNRRFFRHLPPKKRPIMATIYDLKPAFQKLLRPFVNRLADARVTPNQVTMAALALSAVAGMLITAWPRSATPFFLLPLALFLRMAFNAVDGMLAREHDMRTNLGALLNEAGDVVSDALLYLPFARVPGISPTLVVSIVLMAALTEIVGLTGVRIGASRRYDGPMGKSDRAFAFGVLALLIGFGFRSSVLLNGLFAAVFLLLIRTIYNRAVRAIDEASA